MAAGTIQDGCAVAMADNRVVDGGSPQSQPDTNHIFVVGDVRPVSWIDYREIRCDPAIFADAAHPSNVD